MTHANEGRGGGGGGGGGGGAKSPFKGMKLEMNHRKRKPENMTQKK